MSNPKKSTIEVQGAAISILSQKEQDYICLTDIARYKNAERTDDLVRNWLRNRNTVEFLGVSERLNNPAFNPIEFDGIRKQAELNSFILTAKRWIDATRAVGLISKAGRNGWWRRFGYRDGAGVAYVLRRVEEQAMKNTNLKAKLESAKQEIYSLQS